MTESKIRSRKRPTAEFLAELCVRIEAGDSAAVEEVYGYFGSGIRYLIVKQLGPEEIEDHIQNTFLLVLDQIRRGQVRDKCALRSFIQVVVRRYICSVVEERIKARERTIPLEISEVTGGGSIDPGLDPEQAAIQSQRVRIMREMLAGLDQRDRDILTKFYVEGKDQAEICREMGFTSNQFRLRKSRLKQAFIEEVRERLVPSATTTRIID